MRFNHLAQWLTWLEQLHPQAIDLKLQRIKHVYQALGLVKPARLVITVAGTNGKGSVTATLAAIYQAAGYRVGLYSSPHLLRFNERIRIEGADVSDQQLCASFARIDQARGTTTLTYFEFATLAAFDLFEREQLDIAILEVGLGGRLDATNIIDCDMPIITRIGIDHTEFLGDTREAIATEKAGIYRPQRPIICADRAPPLTLISAAQAQLAPFYAQDTAYSWQFAPHTDSWLWCTQHPDLPALTQALPLPVLKGKHQLDNAACVIAAIQLLQSQFAVSHTAIIQGLTQVRLRGRFDCVAQEPRWIADVTHNPQGAQVLCDLLTPTTTQSGKTYAIIGMLADKDAQGVAQALSPQIDFWLCASLSGARGQSGSDLMAILNQQGITNTHAFSSVAEACHAVRQCAEASDTILVFGSFHTVAEFFEFTGRAV